MQRMTLAERMANLADESQEENEAHVCGDGEDLCTGDAADLGRVALLCADTCPRVVK